MCRTGVARARRLGSRSTCSRELTRRANTSAHLRAHRRSAINLPPTCPLTDSSTGLPNTRPFDCLLNRPLIHQFSHSPSRMHAHLFARCFSWPLGRSPACPSRHAFMHCE
ncbi:uncharacterized protein B0H18DRAFT_1004076 [Fomitopsis serialis]|uniref:uncharacterized protein n=1 Tax=Fomitopsis serialis TaxID=139415 RepID=UPI002007AD1B|nr:uncharacterized protein B0H18DRAFT_1004076 [Neoantrodia serialis]KAH9927318.1 hypothetical protein B0H18DRAFT_1004076 [Neoantrodia serialis]